MGIGSTLCQFGRLLDEWDSEGVTIDAVTVADETGLGSGVSQTAEVTLSLPLQSSDDDSLFDCTPQVTDEGAISLTLEADVTVPDTVDQFVDIEVTDATVHADGTVAVTVSTTVSDTDESGGGQPSDSAGQSTERWSRADESSNHETAEPEQSTCGGGDNAPSRDEQVTSTGSDRQGDSRNDDSGTSSRTGGRSRNVPPFRDPELLQEVYDAHDTFAEMAEALDMDVTGETVRRYMIDYDIHQPNSYRTSNESGPTTRSSEQSPETDHAQEAVVISDGIGLPENVSVEDLIETVNRSNTIYEVKEDLDLERTEAHEMLKELNLIDLVLGRLSNDAGREITRQDVIDRLRNVSATRQRDDAVPAT